MSLSWSHQAWRYILATGAIVTAFVAPCPAAERANVLTAANSIHADELQTHVDVLADDSFEGRAAGTRGGQAAGMYLLRQLEQRGLKAGGDDGSHFQAFGSGYRNVLGILEGSDPKLRDQFLLIGAHYDHVGYGSRRNSFGPYGYIHNGADDNASGASALLEVADAFLQLPTPPRRSVIFAFWDAEENGLLGSKHFVANPTVPLSDIAFMINLDMIGRLREKLEVFGSRTGVGLRRLVAENNYETALTLDFDWELKANSDHHPFVRHGIPALMFHTGLHDDYHRPSDDADLINADGIETVSRLLFSVAADLADREKMPEFRSAGRRETPSHKKQLERTLGRKKPRLGVRWYAEQEGDGLQLAHVESGSAADRSGLQVGDRILAFDGQDVTDADQFRQAVLYAASPTTARVLPTGSDAPRDMSIELDGQPTRVGISWREDDAAPGSVFLTRVVAGSPADQAGLQVRDRIYEVGGEPFADGKELYVRLVTWPGPLELTIERNGRLQTVTLDVQPPRQGRE